MAHSYHETPEPLFVPVNPFTRPSRRRPRQVRPDHTAQAQVPMNGPSRVYEGWYRPALSQAGPPLYPTQQPSAVPTQQTPYSSEDYPLHLRRVPVPPNFRLGSDSPADRSTVPRYEGWYRPALPPAGPLLYQPSAVPTHQTPYPSEDYSRMRPPSMAAGRPTAPLPFAKETSHFSSRGRRPWSSSEVMGAHSQRISRSQSSRRSRSQSRRRSRSRSRESRSFDTILTDGEFASRGSPQRYTADLLLGTGGCWTCWLRRKKCDENREGDSCHTCIRLSIECLGWGPERPGWMQDKAAVKAYRADIKAQLARAGFIRGQPRSHYSLDFGDDAPSHPPVTRPPPSTAFAWPPDHCLLDRDAISSQRLSSIPFKVSESKISSWDVVSLESGLPPSILASRKSNRLSFTFHTAVMLVAFILFDIIPRHVYLHILLRIPSLYFSRVTRIFEDARLSLPDIKRMAQARAEQWDSNYSTPLTFFQQPLAPLPRSLLSFRSSWESFVDSLIREWKTLNVISVLLLSAILTLLQIDAASHPITRTTALFSLICALMSLLYGCMYIIRFGTMRKMHKASSLATEAQNNAASIWWNIWVLLAMPAIWLSWSIITFFASIMSFIWLSGSSQDLAGVVLSPRAALGPRIGLTFVFSLGLVYLVLIVREFHRYGDPLDREWMRTVDEWAREIPSMYSENLSVIPQNCTGNRSPSSIKVPPPLRGPGGSPQHRRDSGSLTRHRNSHSLYVPQTETLVDKTLQVQDTFASLPSYQPRTTPPPAFFKTTGPSASSDTFLPMQLIMKLGNDIQALKVDDSAPPAWTRTIGPDEWVRFMLDISGAWNGHLGLAWPEAASTTNLPAYTLLQPPRPSFPILTSPELGARQAATHARSRSLSESSYGHVRFSKCMDAAFTVTDDVTADGRGENTPSPTLSHTPSARRARTVKAFIDLWNERYFHPRNFEVCLVRATEPEEGGGGPEFCVVLRTPPVHQYQ